MSKIKIDAPLYERIRRVAALAGYASADEFVIHVIEKELSRIEGESGGDDEQQVIDRLKGLGYLE